MGVGIGLTTLCFIVMLSIFSTQKHNFMVKSIVIEGSSFAGKLGLDVPPGTLNSVLKQADLKD